MGINAKGDIVGRYRDATATHGFRLSNGAFTKIEMGSSGVSLGCLRDLLSEADAGTWGAVVRLSGGRCCLNSSLVERAPTYGR